MRPPGVRDSKLFIQLLFWAAVLVALVMALLPHPPPLPGDPPDKVQHALAFAVMAFLGVLAFPRLSLLKLLIALSVFGAFIEVAQAIPSLHRDSDPLDWVTDTIASAVVLLAIRWWRARKA